VEGDEGLPTAIIFIEEQSPSWRPHSAVLCLNLLLKGTGSQDEIPIFWQKWELLLLFKFLISYQYCISIAFAIFPEIKVKVDQKNNLLVTSSKSL
jgi:hypothetical protein